MTVSNRTTMRVKVLVLKQPCTICVLLLLLQLAHQAWSCPDLCTCKWKNGKQTVECVDKAMTLIPNGLDHGTQVLEFSGNNLQVLPRERFKTIGLVNLQKIFLARCKIVKIDDDSFKGLSNLVELDLSENLLINVPTPIFSDFPSLMRLTLSENPIKTLKSHGFQHLTFLTTLELSNCDISLIEDEAFIGLSHLEWLKLDGNKLTTMRGSHILPDTLHGVDLHNNRWQCDCNSQDLYTWLLNFNIPHSVEPKCSSPSRLSGHAIKSLSENDLACLPDVSPTTFYLEISEGKNVSLLCQVSAIPEAKVSWWFQGQVLQNDSMVAPGIHLYYYIEEGTVEKRSELFIYNTNSEDNGTFACIAENPAGKSQSNYTIRVIVKEEPVVIVVTFPFEYILTFAIGAGLVFIIVMIIIIITIIKCKRNKKRRKKKESSKEVALQYPTNLMKSGTSGTCADSIPPKLNGSILVTDQHHHVAMYANPTRDLLINNLDNSVCFNPTTLRSYQIEQNPDLINDTESVGQGRKAMNDDDSEKQNDPADEESSDNFDTSTVLSLSSAPPRQVKWQDQQKYLTSVATLPRGVRQDMYQHVADVHLNPGCFLDSDGYPIDFGLPKIQTMQQPIMVTDGQNNFYRTLPHNRNKVKAGPNQSVRFAREAEFFVRTNQPPSYEHYSPADVRYTVEGYPYTQPRQVNPADPNFIPSPPEGYKSGALSPSIVPCCTSPQSWPHCVPSAYHPQIPQHQHRTSADPAVPNGVYISTRCVPTQTSEADSRLASDKSQEVGGSKPKASSSSSVSQSSSTKDLDNPSESPDEGYVGDGVEAPEI